MNFTIAGFQYYQGTEAFEYLKIGKPLLLELEPQNRHDENAVEIYLNTETLKLGYILKQDNHFIAEMLRCEVGHIFEPRIQNINTDEHPNKQINVVIHTVKPN
jgi:CTP:phosphocholine cytidylyltransferase-like protein